MYGEKAALEKLCVFSSTLIIAIVAFSAVASAQQFQCSVKSSCTGDESEIFSMWDVTNAHAEIASLDNYPYKVCCGGLGMVGASPVIGSQCSGRYTAALVLSSQTNAHAGNPLVSGYTERVCLSTQVGQPWCTVVNTCPSGTVCLASISSDDNAHVGDCGAYSRKVCCRANRKPVVDDIVPPPGDDRGLIDFTASITDPDDDPIRRVEFMVTFTGGSRDLGAVTSEPWSVTWNSTADITGIDEGVQISARAYDGAEWGDWHSESFAVNNTPPMAWITAPPAGVRIGRIFDVHWEGNEFAYEFEFQYADRVEISTFGWGSVPVLRTSETSYTIDLTSEGPIEGRTYCMRIKGVDQTEEVPGNWSCDPAVGEDPLTAGCLCFGVDSRSPCAWVELKPKYTKEGTFSVEWNGNDTCQATTGSGVDCYQLEYKVVDNRTGNPPLQDWTLWTSINNDAATIYTAGGCVQLQCTDALSGTFNQSEELGSPLNSQDHHTFYFRVRAIDAAYGCANVGNFWENSTGTWIDWHVPPNISVWATDMQGDTVSSPDGILYTPSSARFFVTADVAGEDYTGVSRAGMRYWILKPGAGYVIMGGLGGIRLECPLGQNVCQFTEGPWDRDYNITYKSFAVDMAGNMNESVQKSFLVLKPVKLISEINNIYMTLGSYKIVPMAISNRQTITENITIKLIDYPFARFSEEADGIKSSDGRELNLTLVPKETKNVHIKVYTSETGEDYRLIVHANSTRSGFKAKVNDRMIIDITVIFPHDFSGLTWPAVLVLLFLAAAAYARFGTKRDDS